jgi:serine protease Do
VQIAPVTKEVAESIGLGKPSGALVQNAEAGGPADKAGIEAGDIITKVDGKAVEKAGDLPRMIGNTKPGTKTTLQIFRRGNTKDVTVTVAEFEADKPVRRAGDPATPPPQKSALGLAVADLSDAQKRELRLRGGVRVEAVDGAAARAGLREGDVILAMDNAEISDVKQFNQLAQKAEKAKAVSVLVRRGEAVNYMVIKPNR